MILGVDVWEGSLEINEPELLQGGVKFVVPRLNSISGGLHLDDEFNRQWAEAKSFLRAPYYVYNPWVSGVENARWLNAYIPSDAPPRVFCDVEVRKDDYPAAEYADQVEDFIDILLGDGLAPCIYTGAWFLPFLSRWPTNVPYWWARYPYDLYPPTSTPIIWADLAAKVEKAGWYPDPLHFCPGDVKLWQCSADRYIPTGTLRTMDINAWRGTLAELETWWGAKFPTEIVEPEPATGMQFEVLADSLNVRSAPSSMASKVGLLSKGQVVTALNVGGTSAWIEIAPNRWAAVQYGSARWMRVK